jgi:hypothetical protein
MQWFQGNKPLAVKARPRVLRAESTPTLDHMVSDAAEAYPADLGVERFERHLLFVKPNVLLVADEIRLKEPREMELRFHPEQQRCEPRNDAFVCAGKSAMLRIESLTPDATDFEATQVAVTGRHGQKNDSMLVVRLKRNAAYWRNAVALSWAMSQQPMIDVDLEMHGEQWVFHCGPRLVSLDWTTGRAE